jgi:hypothetical protein
MTCGSGLDREAALSGCTYLSGKLSDVLHYKSFLPPHHAIDNQRIRAFSSIIEGPFQ